MRTRDKVTSAPPRPRTIGLFEALGFFAPYGQRPCIEIVQPWTTWSALISGVEDELHAGALALARRGFRIFPVWAPRVGGDTSSGKIPIPQGWTPKATTDESQINIWWRGQWRHKDRMVYTPDANIGIACGEENNLTVVDLDDRPDEGKNGPAVLAALEAQHGALPPGPVVCRGTSQHRYFQHVPGLRSVNGVPPGVDLKTDGGYVVAPPSVHRTGGRYRWLEGTEHLPLPVMPPWLVEIFMPKPKERRARKRLVGVGTERQDKTQALIAAIRDAITVDDVLDSYGWPTTPCVCPLHEGADNPKAFTSYAHGWRWRCWTRCEDGESDGDVIDLIRKVEDCSFFAALEIAVRIAEPEPDEDDTVSSVDCADHVSAGDER